MQVDVFVAMDYHKRSYGSFHGRVHLLSSSPMDASLVITEITLEDYGKYKCEVIDGLEDGTVVVSLDLEGTTILSLCSFAGHQSDQIEYQEHWPLTGKSRASVVQCSVVASDQEQRQRVQKKKCTKGNFWYIK